MRRLILIAIWAIALSSVGCEVSEEIVGHALDCGLEAADSVAGELIIPDDVPILSNSH